jgi:hypothetical protein
MIEVSRGAMVKQALSNAARISCRTGIGGTGVTRLPLWQVCFATRVYADVVSQ